MKITKTQLKQIIREAMQDLDEIDLAQAFQQKQQKQQAQGSQQTPEERAKFQQSMKGGQQKQQQKQQVPPKLAVAQALAGKLGKEATQLIMSKLDDQSLKTLMMVLSK